MSDRLRFRARGNAFLRCAAVLSLAAGLALPAHGGGPLQLVNQQPVVYPNGGTSLTLNLDQGPLGSRTNAQATAIVQNAIAMWNGVSTSTMRLNVGPPLAIDYTIANYANVYQRFTDGLNPVIFDTDGSITDAIFGVGAKQSVLGFAGSAYYTSGASAGKYAEGQAVLNGSLNVSDATWTVVLAHEIGHFFGLDHSQLDGTQGLATSNYVLMYPIAYRTLQTLHEDDIAAVTSLYPTAGVSSVYGQLDGTFTTAGGTPILGANIWARENATGKVYSVVSDFLTQGNGYFRLYLPAGTYTLNAESIASNFNGGSGVGPYSDSASSASFQAPHPITPVALGAGAAQPIVITAGCSATATFRLDGSGGVSGTCAGSPSATTTSLTSSTNPSTAGASVTFTATVSGNAPTGSVAFSADGATLSGCSAVALAAGSANAKTATCSTASLSAASHSVVARYGGNGTNAPSQSAPLSQAVNAVASSSLVNPSFETPALGSKYQYSPSGSGIGWTFSPGSGIQGNGSAFGAAAAPNGTQTAFIQGTGSISQTLSLAAGSYTLSLRAAKRSCCVSPYLEPLRVTVDGTQVGSLVSPSSTSFGTVSIVFTVATGAHTIMLAGTDASDKTTFIDNVTLNATATTASSLVNPSFEIPALGGNYQYNPGGAGIGWTFSPGSGIQGNGSAFGAASAPNGTQTAFIQGTGSISQTLSLAGGSYTLSLRVAKRSCCVTPNLQPLRVTVDGTQIGNLVSPGGTSFSTVSVVFTVATGAHTIALSGTDPSDKTTFIDSITVQ